jgi:hypothetical protein
LLVGSYKEIDIIMSLSTNDLITFSSSLSNNKPFDTTTILLFGNILLEIFNNSEKLGCYNGSPPKILK